MSRQEQKAETRAAVLAAARSLFAERGFEGTTLKAVAQRAGVAVGTVFVHVPDKGALLVEALHDDLAGVLAEAELGLTGHGRAALLELARALYAYYARDPALSRVLVKESLVAPIRPDTPADGVLMRFLGRAAGLLAPDLRADVAPGDAAAVFFSLYAMVLLEGLRRERLDPDAMAASLGRLLDVACGPMTHSVRQEV